MLKFNVRNQSISRIDNFSPAEKSNRYLIANFCFKTDDWIYTEKTAVFRNLESKKTVDMLIGSDGRCVVPWEVIDSSGNVEVSVYGIYEDGSKITTDIERFYVNPTIYGGSATQEPTPTIYEQLLYKINNVDGGNFTDWYKED